jgi:hypothetical protein
VPARTGARRSARRQTPNTLPRLAPLPVPPSGPRTGRPGNLPHPARPPSLVQTGGRNRGTCDNPDDCDRRHLARHLRTPAFGTPSGSRSQHRGCGKARQQRSPASKGRSVTQRRWIGSGLAYDAGGYHPNEVGNIGRSPDRKRSSQTGQQDLGYPAVSSSQNSSSRCCERSHHPTEGVPSSPSITRRHRSGTLR